MRIAAGLACLLLAVPVLHAQPDLAGGPSPSGGAHAAGDGQHLLDEAALTAAAPYGLAWSADHTITVTLGDHPLLDRSSVRLVYAVEGSDPAQGGRQVNMAYDGQTGQGDRRFVAVLRPSDLQGPLAQGESLVRFLVKYRIATEQVDAGPGDGYRYVRDQVGPRALQVTLDNQEVRAVAPGSTSTVRVQLADAGRVASAILDVIAEGTLYQSVRLADAGGGQWSTQLETQNLPRGLYLLRVRATDSAGNLATTSFPDRLVVGTENPGPVPAGHLASDGERNLTEHQLTASPRLGLNRGQPHDITVRLATSLPARVLDVRLHYTLDGSAPTLSTPSAPMLQSSAGPADNAFTATLQPQDRPAASPEPILRFFISISSPYFPTRTDAGYAYVDDGQGPRLSSILFDGQTTFAGGPNDPVKIRVPATDGSPLGTAHLELRNSAGLVKSFALSPVSGAATADLSAGLGVARGTYSAVAVVEDAAGNVAELERADAVHVGEGPPGSPDTSQAVTVQAGDAVLDADELRSATRHPLDGLVPHAFHLVLDAPQDGEEVAVSLQYEAGGQQPTSASPQVPLERTAATAETWTYGGELSSASLRGNGSVEHPVAFRFKVTSSFFGTRTEPEQGAFAYLWDGAAPRIEAPLVNGKAAAIVQPTTPLHIEVPVTDAGLLDARLQVLEGSTVRFERRLQASGAEQSLDLPSGLGLPGGVYDIRILATDQAGHEAAPYLAASALTIDASAPGVAQITFNGAARLEAGPDRPLEVEATLDDDGAASVRVELIDEQGVAGRAVTLQQTAPRVWRAALSAASGLATGAYYARTQIEDKAGNRRTETTLYPALVIDAAPPTVYTDLVEYAAGTKQAARAGDSITIQVGVAEANTLRSVRIQLPDGAVEMTPLGGAIYRHTVVAPASSGPASYAVAAVDQAGNVGTGAVLVRLDSTPPTIPEATVHYPENSNTVATGDEVRITAQASDEHTSVRRLLLDATRINGVQQVVDLQRSPGSSSWETTVQILAGAGTYSLPVIAQDEADNRATRSVTVVVRNEGPAITELLLNGHPTLYARPGVAVRIEAHVAADEDAVVNATISTAGGVAEARADLAASGARSYATTLSIPLPEGRHRVEAVAADPQGRQAAFEDPDGRLIIDGTAPKILEFTLDTGVSSPDAGHPKAIFGSPIGLKAALSDLSPLNVTVTVTGPGGTTSTSLQDPMGSASFYGSLRLEALGMHTFRLTARDAVGLVSEVVRDVEVIAGSGQAPGPVQNLHQVGDSGTSRPTFAWDTPLGAAPAGYALAFDAAPGGAVTTRQNTYQAPTVLAAGSHTVRIRALGADGNPGSTTELPFTVATPSSPPPVSPPSESPSASTPPTGPAAAPTLASPGLGGSANATPVLSWSTSGPAQCVQVQASLNGGAYQDVEACTTATSTRRLAELEARDGDNVTVRARVRHADGTWGAWQQVAHYRVDSAPPSSTAATTAGPSSRLELHVESPDGEQAVALVYAPNGSLVARVPLSALGNGSFAGNYTLPAGDYTVRYEVQDAAGNTEVLEDEVTVQGQSSAKRGGVSGLVWTILLAVACLATLGVVLLLRRRRGKAAPSPKAPPPPAVPPETPPRQALRTRAATRADEAPAEARGIETMGVTAPRRVLAAQDRAGVGPEGSIRLFR